MRLGCWISSAPGRVHNRTDERLVQLLALLRQLRFTAPELADLLEMPCSTISGILKRIGLGKLGRLGLEPAQRYERERLGELIHIDVKKLGRIHGAGKRYGYRRGVPKRADLAGVRRGITGWAYAAIYASSADRTAALDRWLWQYNQARKHSALGRQPPITRLNNLLGSYS